MGPMMVPDASRSPGHSLPRQGDSIICKTRASSPCTASPSAPSISNADKVPPGDLLEFVPRDDPGLCGFHMSGWGFPPILPE